jgi:uncharacterized protein YoxC
MITVSSTTGPGDGPLPTLVVGPEQPRRRGKLRRRLLTGIALVAALGIGIGIGTAAGSNTSALNKANSQVSALEGQVASLKGQASSLTGQVSSLTGQVSSDNATVTAAQGKAATAQQTANANAAAAYKGREAALAQTYQGKEAALSAQQQTVKQQEATLKQELGQVQASQISGDGVYVVGKDIKAGTWHTNGSGNTGQNDCYFATLNSTDTTNIADNNNFDGAETVDVSSAYAFQVSGPCTWVLAG